MKIATVCALLLTSNLLAEAESTPSAPPAQESASSRMMIDPKMRAEDLQQAYDLLKKEKTAGKVYFQLSDGSLIGNVIDMHLMTHGTLILFRYNGPQGIRLQVVKTEEITALRY